MIGIMLESAVIA